MLVSDLADVVGFDHCLTDPDLRAAYEVDWTGRYRGHTLVVVRPGTLEELAAVMRLCNEAGQPVVVQGGNTGLVGGSVPLGGEYVVSVARLGNVGARTDGPIRAGAGATLAAVQRTAETVGGHFGVDTAARDSATVGGMVATNAGGMSVVRFGPMGDQVVDAGVVLADGSYVPSLRSLLPTHPAAGLLPYLPGSEGTLAVVAHVDLRVSVIPDRLAIGLIEVPAEQLPSLLDELGRLPELFALELFGGREVALAAESIGRSVPLDADWLVLAECRADEDPVEGLQAACGELPALVATSRREGGELWLFRESLTEAVSRLGLPHKFDVRVPHAALNDVRAAVTAAAPASRVFLWGHAFSDRRRTSQANLHVNIVGPVDDEAVFDAIEALGGSVAAEHGVGSAKRHRAGAARVDLAELRRWKGRLDPVGILNPGVLFPPPGD